MAQPPRYPDEPLPEEEEEFEQLKHDAVPGYPRIFAIAFASMALYLLLILFTSSGPAKGSHSSKDKTHHDAKSKTDH
ncbi:MAG: hypothetical protein AAGA58_07630 [Verrucomicrobiota bacterium]